MKRLFFNSCVLAMMSFGNSLTSFFDSLDMRSSHVNEVAEEIQSLLNHKIDPLRVYIPYMRIETDDIPVQYLKEVTLYKCVLSGFDFDGVDLSQINFIDTQLENCNLKKAIVWEVLTYNDVVNLIKNQPQALTKIYSDFIEKNNQYYSDLNYNQSEYYHKKADQFYQTLKTINCSQKLEPLKSKLVKVLSNITESYNKPVQSNDFNFQLAYKLDTIIDKYEKNIS